MRETKKEKFKNLFEYYGFTKKDEKKYPVISRILKKLTPERIKKEIEMIQTIKLPSKFQKWVREYEKVGERNNLAWKQLFIVSEIIRLPIVLKRNLKLLQETKFLFSMFVILVDDIVDEIKSEELLSQVFKIPFQDPNIKLAQLTQKEKRYLKFTKKVWENIRKRIRKLPRYKEFYPLLECTVGQFLNGMKYNYFINKHCHLINKTDCQLLCFFCNICSVQTLAYFILDFMSSSRNMIQKFRKIRKIVWHAQKMTVNGNWVSTWKEEIQKNDFTSGILAYAIDSSVLKIGELKNKNNAKIIKQVRNSRIEKDFLKKWDKNYREISKMTEINIKKYLYGLEKLLILSLSAKHLKV